MKLVIIIAIAFVLLIPTSAFGTHFIPIDDLSAISIRHPDNWAYNDERNKGNENLFSYSPPQGNAFLYVALDESPSISTSKSGNSYLNDLENYWKNRNLINFEIIDSKISSWNGKNAYVISFFYGSSDNLTKRIIIEIPENGKTWRISNDFNIKNSNGEISTNTLLNSFEKISIIESERDKEIFSTDVFYQGFDQFLDEKIADPSIRNIGKGYLLVYTNGQWTGTAWFDKMLMGKMQSISGVGNQPLQFSCVSQHESISGTDQKLIIDKTFEFKINSSEPVGIAVMKDGQLITKKNSALTGTVSVSGLCKTGEVESFVANLSNSNNSNGGGCLIATATYGSELAPQVQQLRELRDNQLLNTESGTSFMKHFNDFYYSFSPVIADYERENPVFKEMVKIAITPMVSSLSILNYVDMDSESEVLGYGISLIVLNGLMYVGIPIAGIITIRKRF